MPSFIDIRFDLVSAENERTSAPELIERAFVDVDNITEHVLQSEKFIVYGPKGAGKTALAERLESLADESLFVKIDNLEDFDFRIFQTFAKPSSATVGGPVAVWKSLLALGLLSVLAADEAFTATNPAMAQLYARLNESRFSPQTTLKAIAEDSVRRGRTFFEWLSTPFLQPDVPPPSDPATAWDALRNSVTGATPFSGNRHLLILDGLDFRLRETAPADSLRYADYLRYVDELLTAVKAVNAEFASVGAKVMVLIRNEILFASSDSNIQKTVFDRGIEMWWYHHGKPEHSDLLKMVSMRAELAGYRISPEYVVRRWFDEPSIVEDILACTRHLPRDVILFFNSLQTLRKNPPFSRKDFHHALRVYSPLFLSALNDSVKGLLPNAVRQQLQHVLKDLPTRFSFGELRTSLQRRGLVGSSFPSAETIAHELFATGWIGNQRQQGPRYSFQYRNMGLTFDQRGTCVVHRGLGPVLGI